MRRRGSTIVELNCVVVIIGMLVTLVMRSGAMALQRVKMISNHVQVDRVERLREAEAE